MPYQWSKTGKEELLRAWPHRSLPRRGFVWFIGITAALLTLPLMAVLGSVVMWALLPFMLGAIAAVWWAISHSYRTGSTLEELRFAGGCIALTRHEPGKPVREWRAKAYWIRAIIRPGPVESYLVLVGDHESGREIEFGAFLAPEERVALLSELNRALARHSGRA